MNRHYTYLLINFFCLIVPFIFSFHPKIKFYKRFSEFFLANLLILVAFVTWDIVFTLLGVWDFNPDYVTGVYLFHLPVEEILFFVCIPFACVFTYHCIEKVFQPKQHIAFAKIIFILLFAFLTVIGFLNTHKYYTVVTFFSLALLILLLLFFRAGFLYNFLLMYLIILVPFFLSNGLLTGIFTDEPVVIYNDEENLGIRLFTIPFEDLFYGMLLLLLNVSLFECFKGLFRRLRPEEEN